MTATFFEWFAATKHELLKILKSNGKSEDILRKLTNLLLESNITNKCLTLALLRLPYEDSWIHLIVSLRCMLLLITSNMAKV